ncbi:MAG: substrate-binding domain-containing protein [Planctomycetota bacterium]
MLRTGDGRITVIDIPDFASSDPRAAAALAWACASRAGRQPVIVAFGLDTALAVAAQIPSDGQPPPKIVAVDEPSAELDAALAAGGITAAFPLPDLRVAAAEAAILCGRGVELPEEVELPGTSAPGLDSFELLRSAHAPILDDPRRNGRAFVLGSIGPDPGGNDATPWRRALQASRVAWGSGVEILERGGPEPAGDLIDLVALGVDAIVLEGIAASALPRPIRAARAAGVPIVAIGAASERGFADCTVGFAPARIGVALAEAVRRALGDGDSVISVRGTAGSRANAAFEGFLRELGVAPGQEAAR